MEVDQRVFPVAPQSLVSEYNVEKVLLVDKGAAARLISWKVIDFTNKGDNYASFVTSVEVKYLKDGQALDVTYVVKLNPCRGFPEFEVFSVFIFKKETRFYFDLVPELNSVLQEHGFERLRIPKCFYGHLEDLKQQLYISDMRPFGFKMFDKRKGMDPAHASLVLRELGRLHASSLLLEDKTKEDLNIRHPFLAMKMSSGDGEKDQMATMLNGHITTTIDTLERVGGYERVISWAESIRPNAKEMLTEGLKSDKFNVLNHGDCSNNNILFRYGDDGEPVEVTLLDLQACRKVSAAIDINYFLYTSMNGDVRKRNLRYLLSIYYDSFRNVMEAGGLDIPFTEDDLMNEYLDKNTVGALFGMMVIPLILFESEDVPEFSGSTDEEFEKIKMELKAKTLEMVDKSPLMKPRFLSIFDELIENGLIP